MILKKGVHFWNQWRQKNTDIKPDLRGANLRGAILNGVNLQGANLVGADLTSADLTSAILRGAHLGTADLNKTDLTKADLTGAILSRANLIEAILSRTDLSKTRIINVNLKGATLTDCRVFGISAWGLTGLEEAEQSGLVITPKGESVITVDNLEVAQFIFLLLHSRKIRKIIDTITSKVVLILGRFTPDRKAVLDAMRTELRKKNYLPVIFDFEKPKTRNMTETVSTLAHIARFVIADLTDAKSVPQELQKIVPELPSVPVQPILLSSKREWGMFEDFKDYNWVLETHLYNDINDLLSSFIEKVIVPAEHMANQIQEQRRSN